MDINNNNPCVDKEVVKVNTEVVIELDINNNPCVHTKVVEVNTEVVVEMDIKNNPCADNIVFKLNVDDEVRKIEGKRCYKCKYICLVYERESQIHMRSENRPIDTLKHRFKKIINIFVHKSYEWSSCSIVGITVCRNLLQACEKAVKCTH